MRFSSWWDETAWDARLRVDLAEIMDDLEPGWAAWSGAAEHAGIGR